MTKANILSSALFGAFLVGVLYVVYALNADVTQLDKKLDNQGSLVATATRLRPEPNGMSHRRERRFATL
jgi:hypothetical protein